MSIAIRLFLVVTFVLAFQAVLAFRFHLRIDNPIWWVVTIAYAFIQPVWLNPLAEWFDFRVMLYRETKERRRKYQVYLDKVKAGSVSIDDFETEAKKVIK